jgi:hypothetical protein
MKLPFDLPAGHLPVIVRWPKVKSRKLADGTAIYEANNIQLLNLRSDRGLFDIGFMLNIRQFAKLSAAEQFTILALQRRLTFCGKPVFPGLRDTGKLFPVEGFTDKYVWAIIPETVITTSRFTVLDLHDQCMAIDEPDALRETIAQAFQGCTDGDVEEMLKRFCNFKPPHVTDISRALNALVKLGIVRKYVKIDRHRRRAVFNMRMTAATRSGIISGMIKAEDMLSNVEGSSVSFSADLKSVGPPAKRVNSTSTGTRRKLKRADYQTKYHSGKAELKRAEKLIKNYESSGYLTPDQFTELRNVQDDPTVPSKLRAALNCVFEFARTDPHMEIPTTAVTKKEKQNE